MKIVFSFQANKIISLEKKLTTNHCGISIFCSLNSINRFLFRRGFILLLLEKRNRIRFKVTEELEFFLITTVVSNTKCQS